MCVSSMLLLIGIFGFANGTDVPASHRAPFSINISTPHKVVKVGSEVKIEITLRNTSDHQIKLGRAVGENYGEMNYSLEILHDNNASAPATKYGRRVRGEDHEPGPHGEPPPPSMIGSEISFRIEPGKTLQDTIGANKLYDLSEPGGYTVQVTRYDDFYSKKLVNSNIIRLPVIP